MVGLPGKSHYPAVPLFFRRFLLLECDFGAGAGAPFNASNTIKESSLNDVGLDGRASACPGAPQRSLASGHFSSASIQAAPPPNPPPPSGSGEENRELM